MTVPLIWSVAVEFFGSCEVAPLDDDAEGENAVWGMEGMSASATTVSKKFTFLTRIVRFRRTRVESVDPVDDVVVTRLSKCQLLARRCREMHT